MSLRKRGGTWWIDVIAPNGERVRRTTGTANKALAQEFHDKTKAELWRIAQLGDKPRHTWNDAVVRWLKEQSHKATAKEDVTKLRWLDKFLGGKDLEHVNRALIDRITDAKLAQGCSNATVNRTLELLRAILRKCVNDWEWLDRVPRVRMLKEATRRVRFLNRDDALRLLAELPEHLADMAAFSLATGLRRANVTGLQWSQVDLARRLAWIHPDQAKARKAIPVPLNAEALALITQAGGEARDARVQLSRQADRPAQHQGLVRGTRAGRDRGFSLARSAAHLGELARAERHAAVRVAGAGGLGVDRRWCGGMRTLPRITWRRMRSGWGRFAPAQCRRMAQIRHSPKTERACIAASP